MMNTKAHPSNKEWQLFAAKTRSEETIHMQALKTVSKILSPNKQHRLTHTHTLSHLWRRRRTHPHCSSSRVKGHQSFGTDELSAHVPLEANPSEFLRRATRQSKSLWSVAKETMSRDRPKARTTTISISAGDVNHSKPALGQQADECCHVWALLVFLVPLTRSQLVTCRDKRGQHTVLEIHGKTCYHVTAATTSYNRSVIWRKLDRHLSHQLKVCCVRPSLGHHGPLTANKSFLVQLLHNGDTTASGSLGLSYLQSGSSSFHTSYPFSHSVTKDGLWNETAWRKKIRGCDQKVETSSGQQMLQQDKINNC